MLKNLYLIITFALGTGVAYPKPNDSFEIKVDLADDESWRLFPTYATSSGNGQVKAKLRAWVYEEEQDSSVRRRATGLLRNLLGLSDLTLDVAIFNMRARYFLVDNERDKSVVAFHKQREIGKGITDDSGHAQIDVTWKTEHLNKLEKPVWLQTKLTPKTAGGDESGHGLIQMIPEQGLSVISDIDDTIKLTGVLNRNELLERTFGKPFEEIKDMAKLYKQLEQNRGATFHYVSSSPWQLLPELQTFLHEKKFPLGSFHLKSFRLKDSRALALFADPVAYKTALIEGILKDLPGRHFYLIGDSGEKDPEIYADIAKRFPKRITGIFIRLVPSHAANDIRFAQTFAGNPQALWQLFTSADEIKL